jgi:hypothetical protein
MPSLLILYRKNTKIMSKQKVKILHVIAVLLLFLLACKADGPTANVPTAQPGGSAVADVAKSTDKNAMVKLVPEVPTVMTDLLAMLSGADAVTYRWEKNGRILDGENTQRLSKSLFAKGDNITVSAIGAQGTASASVVIANSRPKVTSISISPQYIYRGVDLITSPIGYDADGDYVRFQYRWMINGKEHPEQGPILRGDQFKKGDAVGLEVTPSDSEGDGEVYRATPLVIQNGPPKFVSLPPTSFSSNTYLYSAQAVDPDGDNLTYSLSSAPNGMVVDSKSGQVSWKIQKEDAGTHEVEIAVQDEMGLKVLQKYSLDITIPKPDEGKK